MSFIGAIETLLTWDRRLIRINTIFAIVRSNIIW